MRIIDESVIMENIKRIRKTNELIMVLKDNAYGIGICRMVNIAKKCNIDFFAVKSIDEAIFIKSLYKKSKVLLLGKVNKKEINKIIKYKLIPTINDYTDYLLFKENNIKCHLEIDVGMNRFGIKNNYLAIINDSIVDEIYIHLYNNELDKNIKFIEELGKKYNKKIHIGGSVAYGKTNLKIRVGKMLYDNAIYFYGSIVNIKRVRDLETIGYEGLYNVKEDSLIGICDIGYKNGLNNYSKSEVIINGRKYKLIGKTCMDQCFILIDEFIKIGDKVEFIGKNIDKNEFLRANNMTIYEALLLLN